MASPITSIKKKELTPEQQQKVKLSELQRLLAEQEESITKILAITNELNEAGILDAVRALAEAREKIAGIAVNQASREPVTNLINHVMNASGALATIDPETTSKMASSIQSGLAEANLYRGNQDKVGLFHLIGALQDPDINEAVKFSLNFLKGMGKELKRE